MIPVWEALLITGSVAASILLAVLWVYRMGRQQRVESLAADEKERRARLAAAETYATLEAALASQNERIAGQNERIDRLEEAVAIYREARESDHRQIKALIALVEQLKSGIERLTRQLIGAGLTPEWKPDDAIMVSVAVNLSDLKHKIQGRFSIEEMADLALRLDINPEELTGETRNGRAQSLVDYADRYGLVGHLIAVCKELRPKAGW